MSKPSTLITISDLIARRESWQDAGARVALVPTMGALHLGHLSLIRAARDMADRVLVTIFVNPMQFGPLEDLAKYPRTISADLELLGSEQVDAVFLPSDVTMYPSGFQTYVHGKKLALELDGAFRKNHFEGVLTVVLKLFNLVRPDVAVFGKKDYQQLRLIDQMVQDLNVPVKVVGCSTEREPDGLALSSRNRYLSHEERALAPVLYRGLSAAKEAFENGERQVTALIDLCRSCIAKHSEFGIDYIELRQQNDLSKCEGKVEQPVVMLLAARLGSTRLIDNIELE